MKMNKKLIVATAACAALLVGSISTSLAWLMDDADPVTNKFNPSTIEVDLTETGAETGINGSLEKEFEMVPGHILEKDPKVTVDANSEACWLFVKITESTDPDLDAYIAYQIASGWETVQAEDSNGVTVIGRSVPKSSVAQQFPVLGAGSFTDNMGTKDVTTDDYTIEWNENEVGVKPSVTKGMMDAISTNKPTLDFQAYAVQFYSTNDTPFDMNAAWAMVNQ